MSSNNPSSSTGGVSAPGGGVTSGSTSSGGGGGGSGGGGGGPCGACKFLRRKCVAGCIFAPYFDSEQGAAHFAAVHKVFGASNVSKLLLHIPVHKRLDAVLTICFEAQARLRDPVYGCVAHIFALQHQVANLQAELSYLQAHLTTLELPTPPPLPPPPPPPPQQPQTMLHQPSLTIADLPTAGPSLPAAYDLSSLFDPMVIQPSWAMQQQPRPPPPLPLDPRHFGGARAPMDMSPSTGGGGGDLQELARELLHRHGSATVPCTESSALPPQTK